MWAAKGNNIEMDEGDWGVALPISVSVGTTITASDHFKLDILDGHNGSVIISKDYSNISNDTIQLALTQAETAKLKPRSYVWRLAWYQSGTFNCFLVPEASFKVGDTA